MRSVKAIAGAAVSAAALMLLAACGGGGGQDQVDAGAPPEQKPKPKIDVTVTYVAKKGATPQKWHLTCEPNGGDHPNAQAACAKLAKTDPKAFNAAEEKRKDKMCTMIFGGPQKATVTGTLQDQKIEASFNRQNGCEIGAWDGMKSVIQPAG